MAIPKIFKSHCNFTDNQNSVANTLIILTVASIALMILAAYDIVPSVAGYIAQTGLSIFAPMTLCWMLYSCRDSDGRIQRREYEQEYADRQDRIREEREAANTQNRRPNSTNRPFTGRGYTLGGTTT